MKQAGDVVGDFDLVALGRAEDEVDQLHAAVDNERAIVEGLS